MCVCVDLCVHGMHIQWIQQSNTPCRQSVQVCGFSAGKQDNWLITQLINRTVNGVKLPQVSVMVEFEQCDCDVTLSCQQTFNAYKYETSSVDTVGARNINNYQHVATISPDDTPDSASVLVNKTFNVIFSTHNLSFYLSFQDDTSCIVVTRVIVFYYICPSQPANLVHFSESIIAPRFPSEGQGDIFSSVSVISSCMEYAEPENGPAPRLICYSGGVWSFVPHTGCCCVPGYLGDNGTCIREWSKPQVPSCMIYEHLVYWV